MFLLFFQVGLGSWKLAVANFIVEEESFEAPGILSQAKSTTAITSKDATTSVMMRAGWLPRKAL
jgi:hypothetical protein